MLLALRSWLLHNSDRRTVSAEHMLSPYWPTGAHVTVCMYAVDEIQDSVLVNFVQLSL